jgi:hypothetical protein
MRWLLPLLFAGSALAAESPREIDPNTKIQGGADVRGSSSSAGAGEQTQERSDAEKPPLSSPHGVHTPEKRDSGDAEKDKTISERKPQEREREEASRGESKSAPQQ